MIKSSSSSTTADGRISFAKSVPVSSEQRCSGTWQAPAELEDSDVNDYQDSTYDAYRYGDGAEFVQIAFLPI